MPATHQTAWANIARVVKTHATKGEVVVVPTDGLPFLMHEGMTVTLTPPSVKGVRDARVLRVRELTRGWGVVFEGVTGLGEASGLVGKLVLARRSELLQDLSSIEFAGARRRLVHDRQAGDLGRIVETVPGPAYDTWVVRGPSGEVMVPATPPIVVDVPADEGLPIEVDLPKGLVDLASRAQAEAEERGEGVS